MYLNKTFFTLVLLLLPLESLATDFTQILAPQKLTVGFSKNQQYSLQLETNNTNQRFFIRIANGDGRVAYKLNCSGKRGLAAAFCALQNICHQLKNELENVDKISISVNGVELVKNRNIKTVDTYFDVPVRFALSNQLSVQLKGTPGSYINLSVFQSNPIDLVPPTLVLLQPTAHSVTRSLDVSVAGSSNEALKSAFANGKALALSTDGLSFSGTFRFSGEGLQTLQIVGIDLAGNPSEFSIVLTIVLNQTPFAAFTFSFENPSAPSEVTLRSLATDTDGQLMEVTYDFGDGTTLASLESSVVHNYELPGSYRITQTARDNEGAFSTFSLELDAVTDNQFPRPVILVERYSGAIPLSLTLDASSSFDPDGLISRIQWSVHELDGRIVTFENQPQVTYEFSTIGIYRISLLVQDNLNAISISDIYINAGAADGPQAVIIANKTKGIQPLQVSFEGRKSIATLDSPIVSYLWNFGDGTESNSAFETHTFSAVGQYLVALTVTDAAGRSSTTSTTIQVLPAVK